MYNPWNGLACINRSCGYIQYVYVHMPHTRCIQDAGMVCTSHLHQTYATKAFLYITHPHCHIHTYSVYTQTHTHRQTHFCSLQTQIRGLRYHKHPKPQTHKSLGTTSILSYLGPRRILGGIWNLKFIYARTYSP